VSKYGFMEVSRVKHGKNIGLRLKREENSCAVENCGKGKVQCDKEQYCTGTLNVRPMNQGKWDVVK